MAWNPFNQLTRSTPIASTNFGSFIIENGKALPNSLVNANTALKNPDVFAVVNLLSSDLASAQIKAPVPFDKLISRPNALVSGFNFWQSVAASMLLSGNAYVTIKRDQSHVPTKLELIPASQVTIELADYAKDLIYSVDYADERPEAKFKANDMLHFRLLSSGTNQTDALIGISPLESLTQSVNMQDFAGQLTLSTLKNAIRPSIKIKINEGTLSTEEKEAQRKAFEQFNTGKNAGRPLVEDQLATVESMSINSDVAKFLSTMDFGKTQVAEAFGVPSSYLNGQGDQQSSLDQTKSLYANTLRRYTKPIESELSLKFGVAIDFDESSAVDADNSVLISNVVKLSSGQNPVLNQLQAQQLLADRGVIKL